MPRRASARATMTVGLLSACADAVGADHVLTTPEACQRYEHDATGRYGARATAVVRPADTGQVAAVLIACGRHGVAVVPQGGNSGLAGGGVPQGGEVVLSLERLRLVSAIDALANEITVGAGVTLAEIHSAAHAAGLEFTLDLAARSAATAGGLVATNAAGPLAARWGAMRQQVTGLEAVLADGSVLSRLAAPPKDNAGYDWVDLMIGSEGTLGVVTGVRIKLRRPPGWRASALVGVRDLDDATALLVRMRDQLGDTVEAVDFMDRACVAAVCRHRQLRPPLPAEHAAYVIVSIAATEAQWDRLDGALSERDAAAVAVTEATSDRQRLWLYREAINESIRSLGVVHKYDVSLTASALPRFAARLPATLNGLPGRSRLFLYGHLADGNVHVNVVGLEGSGHDADQAVLGLVAGLGGSVNAEHGIGIAKRDYLHLTRSEAEIALMRTLKRALDPGQLLNPGRVLPADTSGHRPPRAAIDRA